MSKKESVKLKPCPFCGGKAIPKNGFVGITLVNCTKCGAIVSFKGDTRVGQTAAEAADPIAAWNRRVEAQSERSE